MKNFIIRHESAITFFSILAVLTFLVGAFVVASADDNAAWSERIRASQERRAAIELQNDIDLQRGVEACHAKGGHVVGIDSYRTTDRAFVSYVRCSQ